MKLEKRSSGEVEEAPVQEPASNKEPVVVYIMILFIVAFLLMALSFFMHQRSNTEALGELQNSVSAMQEIQATQDKVIQLQEELDKTEDEMDALKDQVQEAEDRVAEKQREVDALTGLYTLQQQFSAGDLDACRQTMQDLEDAGLVDLLSKDSSNGVTSPAERYQQLKEAILNP